MVKFYAPVLRVLAFAGAVVATNAGIAGADAQTPNTLSVADLIESAQNERPQDVVGLPGSQLVEILAAATEADRAALLAALPTGDVASLLAVMVLSGAEAGLVADVLASAVSLDPDAAQSLTSVVIVNSSPDALPALAAAMVAEIQQAATDGQAADAGAIEALVQATLALDSGGDTVAAIVALGQDATGDAGNPVARALATIADSPSTGAVLRSRIVAQVAIAGGAVSSAFDQQRAVSDVGDVVPGPQTDLAGAGPDDAPVVPPAIGGGDATSSQTSGSQSGQRAPGIQTASSPSGGSGLSSGGGGASGGGTSTGTPSGPVSPN